MIIITKEQNTNLDAPYKKAIEKARLEIGKKYNRLLITGIDYEKTYNSYTNGTYRRVYVNTQCECGNVPISNQLAAIKSGHIKSCGCLRFNNPLIMNDLTGQKFGRLTVIKRDIERDKSESKRGVVHWLCKCDCGNPSLSSVVGYQLTSGHTQSCGCFASEQISKRNKKYSTKFNHTQNNDDKTITIIDDNNNKCIIDSEDYEILKRWYWRKTKKRGNIDKGYWVTNTKIDDKYNKSVLMLHQVVAEIKYGEYNTSEFVPDHLSRDTDDNRKSNIVLKSNQDNSHNRGLSKVNSSGKTGVCFIKSKGKWNASITVDYKTIYLGDFLDFDDAVNARKEAEIKYGFTCDDNVSPYDEVAR